MSSKQVSPSPRASLKPILKWAWWTILLMAVLTFAITVLLAWASGRRLFGDPELPELLKAATPAAALIAASAAGAVGFLRQRSQEDSHNLDLARHHADLVTRLRERYSASAEQLGHDSVAVRLAGVYALAALADDWIAGDDRSEAQVCIDLLCAYLRVPRPSSDDDPDSSASMAHQAELEVRQSITRVISAHLQDPTAPESWCGMDFDFTGATFEGQHSFTGAHFTDGAVEFVRAKFADGEVAFNEAQFTGGNVTFNEAQFTGGNVTFYLAVFSDRSWVDFSSACFSDGYLSLGGSTFADSRVRFDGSKFREAVVDFHEAKFTDGRVSFNLSTFEDSRVEFDGAYFTGGAIAFRRAKFIGEGRADFSRAEFNGSTVDFDRAEILEGKMHFGRSKFLDGQVTLKTARVHEGEVTFTNAEFTNPAVLHLPKGVQLDPTTGTTQWPPPPELTPTEKRLREQPDLFY